MKKKENKNVRRLVAGAAGGLIVWLLLRQKAEAISDDGHIQEINATVISPKIVDRTFDDPIILANWQIERLENSENTEIPIRDPTGAFFGRVLEGQGTVHFGLISSIDNENWEIIKDIDFNLPDWGEVTIGQNLQRIPFGSNYVAFALWVSDDQTIGEIKESAYTGLVTMPAGWNLRKIA